MLRAASGVHRLARSWAVRGGAMEMHAQRPRLQRVTARAAIVAMLGSTLALSSQPGSAAPWADPAKTLRVAFEIDVTGFDPAATQDLYSNTIEMRIFDALYVWDYLARPYRLVPSVAAAMPEISPDGRTWK